MSCSYSLSLSFVMVDLLLTELCPLMNCKNQIYSCLTSSWRNYINVQGCCVVCSALRKLVCSCMFIKYLDYMHFSLFFNFMLWHRFSLGTWKLHCIWFTTITSNSFYQEWAEISTSSSLYNIHFADRHSYCHFTCQSKLKGNLFINKVFYQISINQYKNCLSC
jgi:hypothetical protein